MKKINLAWGKIAPFWPLKNLIACNPMQGFEGSSFKEALRDGHNYFQQREMPEDLLEINRISIKWFQTLFDQGQAAIKAPFCKGDIFNSWKELAIFDNELHQNQNNKKSLLKKLSNDPDQAITECLDHLKISSQLSQEFLTIMLTSLAGWSSYVKYLGDWQGDKNRNDEKQIKSQFLAIRLTIAALITEDGNSILKWHEKNKSEKRSDFIFERIEKREKKYQEKLLPEILEQMEKQDEKSSINAFAQMVFCIDVRSEGLRRALEGVGNYETFGFAGFFGLSVEVENKSQGTSYSSCPVLLEPSHKVEEKCSHKHAKDESNGRQKISATKSIYQSLKYNFTTPLILAEAFGLWSGILMAIKTISPKAAKNLQKKILNNLSLDNESFIDVSSISLTDQLNCAKSALSAMSLTNNFSKIVIFCGHGSQTENNTYATSLECGACGGNHGGANAKTLAKILNNKIVRKSLEKDGIKIPESTLFLGALHNTTTDEISIYQKDLLHDEDLQKLTKDFEKAKNLNNIWRSQKMGLKNQDNAKKFIEKRSINWSETRPEWGLAKNASFIVANRNLTKNINLDSRSFLHSYNFESDEDGKILTSILTAPMVVAQWINSQYLFSTLDNIAFGSGSKVTQNIVGKIGVMQGNGSDLMHGMSLQSSFTSDRKNYHEAMRLHCLVHAPKERISDVIKNNEILQKLFGNCWVHLFCLNPENNKIYQLDEGFVWKSCEVKINEKLWKYL